MFKYMHFRIMLLKISFLLILNFFQQTKANSLLYYNNYCLPNNVCTNYKSYYIVAISKSCSCVADVYKDPNEVAQNAIQTSEFHEVTTEDGYIIGIFRLPRENPIGVVILQHPMTVSSRIWMNYGNKSSAIEFWRKGYDVWLPNNRGTQYSRKHTTYSKHDSKYWNFDFHEMGLYDHKAVIDYIYNKTQQKLYFVGHSMSTTSIFIYSAYYPEEARDKLELVFAVAPITSFQYVQTPAKYASYFWKPIEIVANIFNVHSFLKWDAWYIRIAQALIVPLPFKHLFVIILALFCGWTPNEFYPPFINLLVISGLSELPLKVLYHYAQIYLAPEGRFQLYDYGEKKNLLTYGSKQPPLYPVENITVPTYLMYSKNDSCSTVKDNQFLYSQLQNQAKIYGRYEYSGLNHLDVHAGKDRFTLLYNPIMKMMYSLQENRS